MNLKEMAALVALFLLCLSVIIGTIAATQCSNKPIIFNFGDSNSDTGGAAVLQGITAVPSAGRLFFHQSTGRFCDGRLIVDFLCESLGTKYLTPYLHLFDADYSNGVNFALAGSDTLRTQAPTTLSYQIKQFKYFHNISIDLNYIREDEFKSALYTIDIGQNDIVSGFANKTLDRVLTLIPTVIDNINKSIKEMYGVGGRNFWVHNTGPLGCLPRIIRTRRASQFLDGYGCVEEINKAAIEFNAQLGRLCEMLQSEMQGSTFVYVDLYTIKLDIIANYSLYRFEESPMESCTYRGSVCSRESRRVFWDGDHYTEAANVIVASKILCSSSVNFNFFCN